tara:strand:- start:804 stop:1013 length:210 start_codon:yes stop_codon:yes gene_type:complete
MQLRDQNKKKIKGGMGPTDGFLLGLFLIFIFYIILCKLFGEDKEAGLLSTDEYKNTYKNYILDNLCYFK